MCLIVQCDKTKPISKELMEDFQSRNDDGFGFMWIKNNKLLTFKSASDDFNLLWEKYLELQEFDPYLHVRFKTHGLIDHNNAHPYNCGYGIWLMHNGVINVDDSTDKSMSDTWHWIDQLIKPLFALVPNPHELIRSEKFKKLLNQQLGSSNRIVMGDRGGFVLFGEKNWHRIDNVRTGCEGMLVSNTYAWDAIRFGEPKAPTIEYQSNYSHGRYLSYKLPMTEEVVYSGKTYQQIYEDLYCDDDGHFYTNSGWHMIRQRQWEAPSGNTIITPSQQVELPLVTITKETEENDDEEASITMTITQEDYVKALVKEWGKLRPYEINTMVYSEPDAAATVLAHLIARHA